MTIARTVTCRVCFLFCHYVTLAAFFYFYLDTCFIPCSAVRSQHRVVDALFTFVLFIHVSL